MPGVGSATLDQLIAAFERAPACAAVAPAYRGRRGNPVLLGGSLFASVASLTGDEGARGLLRARDGVIEIAVDDESVLMDIDTREDLARALGAGVIRNPINSDSSKKRLPSLRTQRSNSQSQAAAPLIRPGCAGPPSPAGGRGMPPFDSTSAIKKQGRESFSQLWERRPHVVGLDEGSRHLVGTFHGASSNRDLSLFLAWLREFQILWMSARV